ncbi:hypothetical protein [Aquipuribacter sp. MA13-6]|uniref:hypothetical protein n=1 Tax=unclassified Aquipuribacter TaxID=2635084 RepID=UPI003EE95318
MRGLPAVRADLAAHGLDLLRAWPRDQGHLLLHVRSADGGDAGWVAGQWFADDDRAGHVAERTRRPHGPGVEHLPGTGVVLQPGGADRRLTTLTTLLSRDGARLVAHRPERRGVVVAPDGTTFTKVVRPEQVDALEASARWRPDGVRVPEVLAVDRDAGTVTTAAVPGRTLHELGEQATWQAWRAVGRAVAALHAAPAPPRSRPHGLRAEADVTRTWLERALRHGALGPGRVEALRSGAEAALQRLDGSVSSGAPVTAHRDLHDKQVLLSGDDATGWSASVLDLDLVAVAEPGLDLANLLVHLLLRDRQAALRSGGAAPARAATSAAAFLAGYGPVPDPDRVADLAVLAAARVAAVYAFRAPLSPGTAHDDDVGGPDVGERVVAAVQAGPPGLGGGRAGVVPG